MSRPGGTTERDLLRVEPGRAEATRDVLAVEEPLELRVAGETVAITMRTPGNDAELGVGFLLSEGLIRSAQDLGSVSHCGRPDEEGYGNTLELTPGPGVVLDLERTARARRGTLTTAACGVCGRRSVDDLVAACGEVRLDAPLPAALLTEAMAKLGGAQENFARTGGVHAAAAVAADGTLLAAYEDVGRHNAVDKVVGALVLRGGLRASGAHPLGQTPAVLVVSGRASFEIVQKAAVARIPVVASVSAPSSLAVSLAERVGVCLAGFVRGARFNVYTHAPYLDLR